MIIQNPNSDILLDYDNERQKRSPAEPNKSIRGNNKMAKKGNQGKLASNKNGLSTKKNMGAKRFLENMKRSKKGNKEKSRGFGDQLKDFFDDITRCDKKQRCGKNNFLQELSNCVCQSLWSRHSDPSGKICQAIPKATRTKAVQVITMFMKGKGPQMPQNKTMIKELKKLTKMWGNTFEKLFMMPFEKEDWKVNLSSLRTIWVIPII